MTRLPPLSPPEAPERPRAAPTSASYPRSDRTRDGARANGAAQRGSDRQGIPVGGIREDLNDPRFRLDLEELGPELRQIVLGEIAKRDLPRQKALERCARRHIDR